MVEVSKKIKPSTRGELEITSVNDTYLKKNALKLEIMGRGYAWLDTGTHDSLSEAGEYVKTLEKRQGLKISCIEELAMEQGFITSEQAYNLGKKLDKTEYGRYIMKRAKEWKS